MSGMFFKTKLCLSCSRCSRKESISYFKLYNRVSITPKNYCSPTNCTKKYQQKSEPEASKATNWQYFKAYVWAMVGDYEQLYRLYMEKECGKRMPGKWANADSKAVDEILLRLYNFEKRLLVAALALLYFAFVGFMIAAIVYFRMKTSIGKAIANNNYFNCGVKRWELTFGEAITFEEFMQRHKINGKIRKATYFSSPNALIFDVEMGDIEAMNSRERIQRKAERNDEIG